MPSRLDAKRLGDRWRRIVYERLLPDRARRRRVWFVLFFAVFGLLLANTIIPERIVLKAGQVAPRDIPAPRAIIDRPATDEAKKKAAAAVPSIYELSPQSSETALKDATRFFDQALEIKRDTNLSSTQKTASLRNLAPSIANPAGLNFLLISSPKDLEPVAAATGSILRRVMETGFRAEALDTAKRQIESEAAALPLSSERRLLATEVATLYLRPNMLLNQTETNARRQAAMDSVEPVRILKGQSIIRRGEIVTERHLTVLQDLGLMRTVRDVRSYAGVSVLVLLMIAGTATYFHHFRRDLYQGDSYVLLYGLIMALVLGLSSLLLPISPFLAPAAAGAMLTAVLIDAQVAVVFAVCASFLAAMMAGGEMRLFFVLLAASLVGTYGVVRVGQRSDLTRAGFLTGVGGAGALLGMTLLSRASLYDVSVWQDLLWTVVGGLFSAVLTIGLLPFLESFFGIITSVRLLEMSNPSQELMQEMLLEAPGTYHHSIIVGNLAEAAAEAVGANALMARVGAYYHDIGKVKRPYFFIDNQFGLENPHDRISPGLSALIITSHVKDGVEMAEERRLPVAIVDIIRQHHGTTLVSYFYSRAAEDGHNVQVAEADYRYEGPRPQSKEAAIVMLADSIEATVRSLARPTPARIESLVRSTIKERLSEGQLDRSDLTLRDLDTIAAVFVRVLTGIFHPRIEYPERVLREMRGWKRRDRESISREGNAGGRDPREGCEP
jgi:putative nucleotidyltransferase with HDIG domain